MKEKFSHIMEQWFIMEPPLFQILCLHEINGNSTMKCPLRCGKRRLEYNPEIVAEMSDGAFEEALRAEAVRLLLKHPYERRPEGCSEKVMGLASNLVIGDNYPHPSFKIETPAKFGLKNGMNYEWYAKALEEKGIWQDNGIAELWNEDELTVEIINRVIESTKNWGSLAGKFAETLQTSAKAKINWHNVFAGFRANIISSKRKLTRMRPNRRTEFNNMGSIRQFDTRLLVAVDVSGSISTEALRYFYGVINSAFRYGFKSIDVIQFDCGIRAVHNLKKVLKDVTVTGRGGTSFQAPIDYAHTNRYDGLVMLTDGYAPEPDIPKGFRTALLWVCENEKCLQRHKHWMEKTGRTCVMQTA